MQAQLKEQLQALQAQSSSTQQHLTGQVTELVARHLALRVLVCCRAPAAALAVPHVGSSSCCLLCRHVQVSWLFAYVDCKLVHALDGAHTTAALFVRSAD